MPKISIIIPVYNIEKYLVKSLNKILEQSFRDIEVILVNDGSTDNSGEICDRYAQSDDRVKVIHKINEGSGPTRNRGIDEAQGKYMMFLDGDDFIEYNMLEKMYNQIDKNNVDLVICNWNEFGNKINKKQVKDIQEDYIMRGKDRCRNTYMSLLKKGMVQCPWNKIYKTDIIKENNIRFPSLRRSQDAVFNCRYFEYITAYKVISDALYNYRLNDTIATWMKFPKEYFEISIELNNTYLKAIKRWKVITDKDKEYLATYFIGDVIGCILYCFSPRWKMNWIERKKYIKYIMSHPKTRESIQISKQETTFARILQGCIKKELGVVALIIMQIKLILQFNMKSIFEWLKKKIN